MAELFEADLRFLKKTEADGSYIASISVSHSQLAFLSFPPSLSVPNPTAATKVFSKTPALSQLNSWSKVSFFTLSSVSSFLILTLTCPSPRCWPNPVCFLYDYLLPD
jgi:hypothetical protein